MDSNRVLDLLHQALRQYNHPFINDVSFDGDNDSSEIILTVDDGKEKTDWVIRSRDVTPCDRDYDES